MDVESHLSFWFSLNTVYIHGNCWDSAEPFIKVLRRERYITFMEYMYLSFLIILYAHYYNIWFSSWYLLMILSQYLIGCSLLSQKYCRLIAWYWIIMRRQLCISICLIYHSQFLSNYLTILARYWTQKLHSLTLVRYQHCSLQNLTQNCHDSLFHVQLIDFFQYILDSRFWQIFVMP